MRCFPSQNHSNPNFLLLQPGKHVQKCDRCMFPSNYYPLVLIIYLKYCNRYKESISKGTRGLKEKLLAHNVSVKELSKGVQREMNAGIAGVARMIERLDLSKRSNSPIIPIHSEGTSDFPNEGKKYAGENGIGGSPSKESEGAVHDVSSDVPFVTGVQSFGPGYF